MPLVAKCQNCGQDFNPRRSWQRYCSDNCRVTFWDDIVKIPRQIVPEEALNLNVKCQSCVKYQQGAGTHRYRWRNATVEIKACMEHLQQIIYVLNKYQEKVFGTETGEQDLR